MLCRYMAYAYTVVYVHMFHQFSFVLATFVADSYVIIDDLATRCLISELTVK